MIKVRIPQYRLVEKVRRKPYYVYVIEVLDGEESHQIEKRYSAFHSLHRELRKLYDTAAFPPKRVRNSNPKVLEQRKQGLELYLQAMLKYAPTRNKVLHFLGIQKASQCEWALNEADEEHLVDHQPIYIFKTDPFIEAERSWKFTNTAVEGTLLAMYGDFHC